MIGIHRRFGNRYPNEYITFSIVESKSWKKNGGWPSSAPEFHSDRAGFCFRIPTLFISFSIAHEVNSVLLLLSLH